MFKRIWQWIVRLFRRLFGIGKSRNSTLPTIRQEQLPPLSDADLEFMFTQLLEGVHQQRGKVWVLKYLQNIEHRVTTERWVEWLRRFGERLLTSQAPNKELAGRMVQLGEFRIGEVGDIAYDIGMQLFARNPGKPIWEYSDPDAKPVAPSNQEGGENSKEAQASTTDNADAWFYQGYKQYEAGSFEEAINCYNKVVTINPNNDLAWYNRGVTLYKLGRHEEAIASYDQVITINPNNDLAWLRWGVALYKLGRYEEAISYYDQAITINPGNDSAWLTRGFALYELRRYEEAISSHDQALKINPNNDLAWLPRGFALNELRRYEEAIASYDQALKINPNNDLVWYSRGFALNKLGRYEEAIASYDQALKINPSYHEAWSNRGCVVVSSVNCDPLLASLSLIARQNSALNQRGYEGALVSFEEGLKHCKQDTHSEGWGILHQAIGEAHYFQGCVDSRPRSYWYKAIRSYNQALLTLTEADYPELHLKVLQDLIRALSSLGQTDEAKELRRRGTDLLKRLLKESNCLEHSKKQLALKFAGFGQLTVDLAVQSGNWCAALEIAEQGKNACLSWILGTWTVEVSSPKWEEIKQLLNPTTAAVYWHLSPATLHTFVLKHDTPSPILITTPTQTSEEELPTAVRRLHDFEDWVKDWNRQYASYRKGKNKEVEAENNWCDNLPLMLHQLANILNIPALIESIQNPKSEIQNLILVPHRDLHRFPLHSLFLQNFTITYLPSAKIGLTLQQLTPNPNIHLLSVEHPDSEGLDQLPFAEIESAAISQLFDNPTRLTGLDATKEQVTASLADEHSIFHFTGHAAHEFNNPKKSYLALTDKDQLTLENVFHLPLTSYRLVSLVACETAITGNQTITTEYAGLVSGFLSQGVSYVISTLWTVESAASAFIMIKFYRLLRKGIPEPIALARAQEWLRELSCRKLARLYRVVIAQLPVDEGRLRPFLKTELRMVGRMELNHKPYAHPYHWAAFTITGFGEEKK